MNMFQTEYIRIKTAFFAVIINGISNKPKKRF